MYVISKDFNEESGLIGLEELLSYVLEKRNFENFGSNLKSFSISFKSTVDRKNDEPEGQDGYTYDNGSIVSCEFGTKSTSEIASGSKIIIPVGILNIAGFTERANVPVGAKLVASLDLADVIN